MMKLITSLIIAIFLSIISLTPCVYAESKGVLPSYVHKYIDVSTIPSNLQVRNSKINESYISQISLINPATKQRFSFTFSKGMLALSEKELTEIMHKIAKGEVQPDLANTTEKFISFKTFYAHNQEIPYVVTKQYFHGKYYCKGLHGMIRNYNGKSIVIQSYGPPKTYSEEAFINLFSNIRFKTDNF